MTYQHRIRGNTVDILSLVVLLLIGQYVLQLYLLPSRVYLGTFAITQPLTINTISLLCIIVFVLILNGARHYTFKQSTVLLIVSLLLLLVIDSLGTALHEGNPSSRPNQHIIDYFVASYLPIAAIIIPLVAVKDKLSGQRLTLIIAGAGSVVAFTSWLFVVSDDIFGLVATRDGWRNYMYRLSLNRIGPTGLAYLCMIMLPIWAGMYLSRRKGMYACIYIGLASTLLMTLSRWAILVAAFIALCMFIPQYQAVLSVVRKHLVTLSLLLIGVTLGLVVFRVDVMRWTNTLVGNELGFVDRTSSAEERFGALSEVVETAQNAFFIGNGPGQVYVRLLTIRRHQLLEGLSDSQNDYRYLSTHGIRLEMPHSIFVEKFVEGGILALGALLFVMGLLVVLCVKQIVFIHADAYTQGIPFSVLSGCFYCAFGNPNNIEESWTTLWLLVGLMLVTGRK
jgi:hypothetical protein